MGIHYSHYESGRGRGRPKKGEIVIRKFTPHISKTIKPENRVKYAKDAIRTADALYRRYNTEFPNPLNIDEKDLSEEARACWGSIFAQRGYGERGVVDHITPQGRMAINHEERSRTKCFESVDEVLFAFECYLNWIRDNNFVRPFKRPNDEMGVMPIIPNQTNFARWLGVPRQLIGAKMVGNEDAMALYKRMLADCLSEGAMVGVYQTASAIFTLKNMCDWADKYEDRSTSRADDLGVAEAEELMKQLGYSRERATLEPPKPILEGEV